MGNISFTEQAFGEYMLWQTEDKKTLKRINTLIKDIVRNPFDGLGKPEPLKGTLGGFWSRRIDDVNRLVYQIKDEQVEIYQCKGHYGDK